jgi:peptide/nickel transport system permease protein
MKTLIRQPGVIVSVLVVIVAIGFVVAPQVFATHDPLDGTAADRFSPPTAQYWFGTDNLGRDVYSRVVYGAWLSLSSASAAVLLGVALGAITGLLAGYLGGVVDFVLMRIVDVLLAVPGILFALIIVAALGFGPVSVAIGVGLGAAGSFARVMRSQVVRVRTAEFVEAARTLGVRWPSIVFRHVLPNTARPVIAMAALELGTAILGVSALSFLGFGAQPPDPEWGSLVSSGRDYVSTAWWLSVLPGAVILVVVLAVNRLSKAIGGDR